MSSIQHFKRFYTFFTQSLLRWLKAGEYYVIVDRIEIWY